jgi:hypothetical protein
MKLYTSFQENHRAKENKDEQQSRTWRASERAREREREMVPEREGVRAGFFPLHHCQSVF